jgi:hypothetical protein
MHKRLFIVIVVVLLSGLLLAQITVAMSSANYKLDWFTPLTSGGGGAASSTHYAINFTIGQTATGASTSTSYKTGLGYWYGVDGSIRVYLPVILR